MSYMEIVWVGMYWACLAQITKNQGLFRAGQVSLEFCRMWAISSSFEAISVVSQDALSSMVFAIVLQFFNVAVNSLRSIASNVRVLKWIGNSRPVFRSSRYLGTCLEVVRKTTRNVIQISRFSGRDFEPQTSRTIYKNDNHSDETSNLLACGMCVLKLGRKISQPCRSVQHGHASAALRYVE